MEKTGPVSSGIAGAGAETCGRAPPGVAAGGSTDDVAGWAAALKQMSRARVVGATMRFNVPPAAAARA
jgi:hypothetical protein